MRQAESSEAEGEVSVRRLRQRERQRRRIRQRVRHRRPGAEPSGTAREEVSEPCGEEVDGEDSSSEHSASESDSEADSEDSPEHVNSKADSAGSQQQREAWKQPFDSLRCYCSLAPDTQLYGSGQRHFERGPTSKYPNRGRKFFCCGQGMAAIRTRCSYFAWAEPAADLTRKHQESGKKDINATLSDKLLQAARAEQDSAKGASNTTVAAKTMEDLKSLTPAAALRKLKKLDRQIAELVKKAADGAELTEQQKAKLGREGDVKKMLVDAEKAAVKAAFAAPQLVIRQAPQPSATALEGEDGQIDGDNDGLGKQDTIAATSLSSSPSTSVPAPVASTAGLIGSAGMDPVSSWYTAVANWIRSNPSGGTGLGE